MDYQTFNSQQHLPPSFGGPFSTSSAAHLGQPATHSPQQQLQYADPHARLQQQSHPSPSPFPYGQFTNGQAGGFAGSMGGSASSSGAMMQPGGLSQNQLHQARAAALHQQQQQQQLSSPSPYSSAPFSQALASPAHHQFVQNRQTASPSSVNNSAPSYSAPQTQQQQSPSLVPSNGQQPMNPPASQPQPAQAMQAQTPVKAPPRSPASPGVQAREKERMTTLLDINNLLIKEVVDLQSQGKAGQVGSSPDGKSEGERQQQSKEYVDCMRRLQSNLAFLAQNAEKHNKPNQNMLPGPAIMSTPSSPDELVKLYIKLQTLYPNWKGQPAHMKPSPGPQRLNSASSQPNSAGVPNNMQPPNSAGLQNNMQPPNSAGLPQNAQLGSNASMNHMNNVQQQQLQ